MDELQIQHVFGQLFNAEDLCEVGEYEDSIALCDDILTKWGDSDHDELPEAIAQALLCRGRSLAALERFEDELSCYDEVVKRFESSDLATMTPHVAEAQFNAAVATNHMGHTEMSIAKYAAFIDRYKMWEEPGIQVRQGKPWQGGCL